MEVGRVWTGTGRRHAATGRAVEGVLEAEDLDAQLAGGVLVEDAVRRVCVVVAADSGVVPTDDEMSAAVVAPDDGVEDRLLGTRVAHPRRVGGEQDSVRRVIPAQQLLVAAHANGSRDVV